MSEYQYYEFLAVDRPLDERQQNEIRALSTRATITATSFVNEYHWGDFRGDPDVLMQRYYDAHLYLANFGTRRVMFRFPRDLVDLDVAEQYCLDYQVRAWTTDTNLILDLASDDEPDDEWVEAQGELAAIVGVRSEIASGDLRGLYLAWLAGFGAWERDEYAFDPEADDDLEPPVPAGLGTLTAAQQALADFLRLDSDLLAVAAESSPPLDLVGDRAKLATWIAELTPGEKDELLVRTAQGHAAGVQMELRRRFRAECAMGTEERPRRNVGDLLDMAASKRGERQRRAAAQRAEEEARREKERAAARERRLDELAQSQDEAWARVETLIATKKPKEYDTAVTLAQELRALADRDGTLDEFADRIAMLRQVHARKPSLIERFNQADLV